jgi:iron complex outermembrane receptor protein
MKATSGRSTKLIGSVSLAALLATGGAAAQEQGATQLQEITVQGQGQGRGEKAEGPVDGYVATRSATGSKTDTPLVETPQTISVVTRDEVQDRGATTLQEAVAYTPGVASFASGRSLFLDEFIIRGFDTAGGDQGQLRDGLKLQANVYDGSQEPYGLERIEILKGPSSILYGQLRPGGIVNSISKRPTFTPQGEINVTGGSFENKQLSADVSGPIGGPESDWAFRLTGLIRDSDTWMDDIPDNKRFVAPALTWRPNDDTSLTLLGYYQQVRTRFKAPMDADGTVFRKGGRRIPQDFFIGDKSFDNYDINSGALGYLFDHEFSDGIKFSSKLRYYEAKGDWDYLTFRTFDPATGVITRGVSAREEHSKVWTADNNLQFKFDTGPVEHVAVVGVDYVHSDYDTKRFRGNNAGGSIDVDTGAQTPFVVGLDDTGFNRKVSQVGVYAQDQMKIADTLVLLAGGRQDWAKTDLNYHRPDLAGEYPKQKDNDFSAHLGAVYLAPYGFAPYLSYSQSFSPVLAAGQLTTQSLKPTTGEQYEGGVRWQSPDEKTLVTASVYRIEEKNVVTFDSNFDLRQSGLVRSKGLELEAKSRWGAWQILASYAYTDAKTIEDEDPAFVGEQVALVPRHQASLWATYDFTSVGVPGLTLGAGVRYFGETNIPDDLTHRNVPDYVMVDALARLDLGAMAPSLKGFQAQLNAKNLFDKKTYSCTSAVAGCNYGQPRTILATLSYKW